MQVKENTHFSVKNVEIKKNRNEAKIHCRN